MSEELGAYEAKRRARVAANRALLLSLNIEKLPAKTQKRPQPKPEEPAAPVERRKSRRLEEARLPSAVKTFDVKVDLPKPKPKQRRRQKLAKATKAEEKARKAEEEAMKARVALIVKDMTQGDESLLLRPRLRLLKATNLEEEVRKARAALIAKGMTQGDGALRLRLRLPMVDLSSLDGHNRSLRAGEELKIDMKTFHKKWLGCQLYPVGRLVAMQGMANSTGARVAVEDGGCVQHWKNATALTVTLNQNAEHVNRFEHVKLPSDTKPKTAVLLQWMAPLHWNDDGSAARRLCCVKRGDRRLFYGGSLGIEFGQSSDYKRPVFLFLRRSISGALVYCGRLGFLGMQPSALGTKFRWELLDTEAFPWGTVHNELTM